VTLLRAEVRAVLASPAGQRALAAMLAARDSSGEADPRPVYRLLGAHRLLAANWPRVLGGRGLPAAEAAVVVEEMIAAGVSDTLHTLSVQICGTFLLSAGSAVQRAWLLPVLARGQRFCTVLYTESLVGSDLSALTTRAEPVPGGGWRLTGRKVYSVRTALADLALVAARTTVEATPYQGISLFLVPLAEPGVTVGTLPSLADEAFADVVLDRVAVGPDAVVGPTGGAWPLITGALALERTGVDHVAKADAWLTAWFADRAEASEPADGAAGDIAAGEVAAGDLAAAGGLRTRVRAARALSRRCVEELDTGRVDPVGAAATKLWCSETAREVATWCAGALHERALWTYRDPDAPAGGRLEAAFREAPGLTISAGTSEMMLELVASAGLPSRDITPAGEEPLLVELRRAARVICSPAGERPTEDDPRVRAELAALGALGFLVPGELGGTGLGLAATLAALEAGRTLALANKESLIVGGPLVAGKAAPGQIVPVDSEHSAIAQCLRGGRASEVGRLVLTASGGPFLGRGKDELEHVTPAQALAHPNWDMGPVVTINSATLVNKGLELIEAHLLFGIGFDRIEVVVHPQSVIHSMVEFTDGATIAQASPPDMRIPIALGMAWPDRVPDAGPALDWSRAHSWTFQPLDHEAFPAVGLAREAGRTGGTAPAVYNAANEICVEAFRAGRIAFPRIVDTVAKVVSEHESAARDAVTLEAVLAADRWARIRARELTGEGRDGVREARSGTRREGESAG